MALNRDVFLSLLALDAYNRGPGRAINELRVPAIGPDGTPQEIIKVGNAQIVSDSSAILGPSAQAAGFYAIAYDWNGETVISYRGTNFPNDPLNPTEAEIIAVTAETLTRNALVAC